MKIIAPDYQKEVRRAILDSEPGSIFFISDFAHLNNDTMVGKILSIVEKLGVVARLARGIYYKPSYSSFGPVPPSVEKVVEAIAKRDKVDIMPTGNTALNKLGLSTQVPMNPVYLTTGSSRKIALGKRQITFVHSAPKNFAYKSKIIPLIVQALKSIGQNNVTDADMQIIESILCQNSEFEEILVRDIQIAPLWIKNKLLPLIIEQNKR